MDQLRAVPKARTFRNVSTITAFVRCQPAETDMKLSAVDQYPSDVLNVHDATIYFNGIKQLGCIAVDDERGMIVRYKIENGKIILSGDTAVVETLFGEVRIEMPPGWKPIYPHGSARRE